MDLGQVFQWMQFFQQILIGPLGGAHFIPTTLQSPKLKWTKESFKLLNTESQNLSWVDIASPFF